MTHSNEGLILEMSAFKSFYGGLDKTKFSMLSIHYNNFLENKEQVYLVMPNGHNCLLKNKI